MLILLFFGSFPLVGTSVPWNDAADSTKSAGGCEKLRDLPVVICFMRDAAEVCPRSVVLNLPSADPLIEVLVF